MQETKRQQLIWLGINRVNYRGCLWWTLFSGNLRKPAITIARIDRLYLNLAVCLQLHIALLLFQNSVKF